MKHVISFFSKCIQFLFAIANDVLFFSGICVVIWTNFRVNSFLGWYSLGAALILTGVGLTRIYKREQK